MAKMSVNQGLFLNFLRGFAGMEDIVITVSEEGYRASGTMERSYYVEKWVEYRDGESCLEEGSITIGQLELFKGLAASCGTGILTITQNDDTIRVLSEGADFTIPTIAEANSQQGVEVVADMVKLSSADNWDKFGEADIQFNSAYEADKFQQLKNAGKAIQTGALYSVEIQQSDIHSTLLLTVVRDQIRFTVDLDAEEFSKDQTEENVILWFGKWLMDALKAMPGKGTVRVLGGADAPLIIKHEAPDNEAWGTLCVIAPRQESGDNA